MEEESQDWLDRQFDRAVEIVQGLSKTGPIQTGYEEKLAMYSLYKQATVGNVPSTRPGIWDVLGRAKWDAWAKHRDMDPREAKRQYVETLLRVLRKYSGRTVARDLARELDSYRPETSMDEEDYEPRSSSSASPSIMSPPPPPPEHLYDPADPNSELLHSSSTEQWGQVSRSAITQAMEEDAFNNAASEVTSQAGARPVSSVSRYRTPMTQSIQLPMSERTTSPPPPQLVQQFSAPVLPSVQPIPRHATPSAYAHATSGSSQPVSSRTSVGYGPSAAPPTAAAAGYPPYPHPYGHIRTQPPYPDTSSASGVPFPGSIPLPAPGVSRAHRPPLERALESMQASLAALHERLESIESTTRGERAGSPLLSAAGGGSRSRQNSGLGPGGRPHRIVWAEGWGMWSIIISPLSYLFSLLQRTAGFLLSNEAFHRSPLLAIIRRMFLDLSFLLTLAALLRYGWRRSGLTRSDVRRFVLRTWVLVGTRRGRERVLASAGVQA